MRRQGHPVWAKHRDKKQGTRDDNSWFIGCLVGTGPYFQHLLWINLLTSLYSWLLDCGWKCQKQVQVQAIDFRLWLGYNQTSLRRVNLPVTLSHRELQTFFLKGSESFLLSWEHLEIQSATKPEIPISASVAWHYANKMVTNFKVWFLNIFKNKYNVKDHRAHSMAQTSSIRTVLLQIFCIFFLDL